MLYKRIESRVDTMIKAGLIDEVKSIQEKGWGPDLNALKTVGYQEVFNYFDGIYTIQEMIERIKINSRRYAKRQMTWLRNDERIHWFDPDNESEKHIIENIIDLYRT